MYTPKQIDAALRVGIPIVLEIEKARAANTEFDEYDDISPVTTPVSDAAPPPDDIIDDHRLRMTMKEAQAYSSAKLGQLGEAEVMKIIREAIPGAQDTHARAHAGDMSVHSDGRVVVEVKNYTQWVPSAQVDKFKRNLTTTNAAGGIFVSLRSKIIGFRENFTIAYEHDAGCIPAIYLALPSRELIKSALVVMTQLLGATNYINRITREHELALESLVRLNDVCDDLSVTRQAFTSAIGEIVAKLSSINGGIATTEAKMKDTLAEADLRVERYDGFAAELSKHARFTAYAQPIRAALMKVVNKIESRVPRNSNSTWKYVNSTYIHAFTGISIRMLTKLPEVGIPRAGRDGGAMLALLDAHPNHVTVGKFCVVNITAANINSVMNLI